MLVENASSAMTLFAFFVGQLGGFVLDFADIVYQYVYPKTISSQEPISCKNCAVPLMRWFHADFREGVTPFCSETCKDEWSQYVKKSNLNPVSDACY